jgi:hypothetical protein
MPWKRQRNDARPTSRNGPKPMNLYLPIAGDLNRKTQLAFPLLSTSSLSPSPSANLSPALAFFTFSAVRFPIRLRHRSVCLVRPAVGVQSNMMATMAIDEDAAHSHLPHLAEGNLDRPAVGVRRRVAADRSRHATNRSGAPARVKFSIPSYCASWCGPSDPAVSRIFANWRCCRSWPWTTASQPAWPARPTSSTYHRRGQFPTDRPASGSEHC